MTGWFCLTVFPTYVQVSIHVGRQALLVRLQLLEQQPGRESTAEHDESGLTPLYVHVVVYLNMQIYMYTQGLAVRRTTTHLRLRISSLWFICRLSSICNTTGRHTQAVIYR